MDYQATLRSYTFQKGYSNTYKSISADTEAHAKLQATRWANQVLSSSTFKTTKWRADCNGDLIRKSDEMKSEAGHRDFIILRRVDRDSETPEEQAEILTPTEKLKALRQTAKTLSDALGKVVTYDDNTTNGLLDEAEGHAVTILQAIHDGDHEDVMQAVYFQMTGENL